MCGDARSPIVRKGSNARDMGLSAFSSVRFVRSVHIVEIGSNSYPERVLAVFSVHFSGFADCAYFGVRARFTWRPPEMRGPLTRGYRTAALFLLSVAGTVHVVGMRFRDAPAWKCERPLEELRL
jgi:hypothetical protein